MENKIIELESELVKYKTTQSLGTGSGCSITVGTIDETYILDPLGTVPIELLILFRGMSINPIIQPEITCTYDGNIVVPDGKSPSQQRYTYTTSTDSEGASITIELQQITSTIDPRDEHVATYTVTVENSVYDEDSHTIRFEGTVYASCPGEIEVYTGIVVPFVP